MQQHMQEKEHSRVETLKSILGQTTQSDRPIDKQIVNQGFEIYTGLDYSLKTTVTTNTVSARNA